MYKLLCISLIGLLLAGCGATNSSTVRSVPMKATDKCTVGLEWQVRMLDLKSIFEALASEVCSDCTSGNRSRVGCPDPAAKEIKSTCEQPTDDLLVADFVDLTTLEPGKSGILLGESMRSGLSRICCRKIQQVELAKYFKLTEKGLVALTRDAEKIVRDQFPPKECVIGTYILTSEKLILFVKRINVADGSVVRMASREITYSCTDTNMKYSVQ